MPPARGHERSRHQPAAADTSWVLTGLQERAEAWTTGAVPRRRQRVPRGVRVGAKQTGDHSAAYASPLAGGMPVPWSCTQITATVALDPPRARPETW